jgi:hypothetical protein
MRYKANVLSVSTIRDEEGRVKKGYSLNRSIRINALVPKDSYQNKQTYGLNVEFSFSTTTFDPVSIDEIIEYKNQKYTIQKILKYTRVSILLLELM